MIRSFLVAVVMSVIAVAECAALIVMAAQLIKARSASHLAIAQGQACAASLSQESANRVALQTALNLANTRTEQLALQANASAAKANAAALAQLLVIKKTPPRVADAQAFNAALRQVLAQEVEP